MVYPNIADELLDDERDLERVSRRPHARSPPAPPLPPSHPAHQHLAARLSYRRRQTTALTGRGVLDPFPGAPTPVPHLPATAARRTA